METSKVYHTGAAVSLVLLIAWLLAWEMLVAPLKPGGSLLALKVIPLLLPLRGVIKRDVYTLQWSSMLILLYFAEGVVRAYSDLAAVSRMMALGRSRAGLRLFCLRPALPAPLQKSRQKNGARTPRQGQPRNP